MMIFLIAYEILTIFLEIRYKKGHMAIKLDWKNHMTYWIGIVSKYISDLGFVTNGPIGPCNAYHPLPLE